MGRMFTSLLLTSSLAFGCGKTAPIADSEGPGDRVYSPDMTLRIGPKVLNLGRLGPGGAARGEMQVENVGRASADIASIESTCECVRIVPANLAIAPGSRATLIVTYGPSSEANFSGALRIGIVGRDPRGDQLFQVDVEVEVDGGTKSEPTGRDAVSGG